MQISAAHLSDDTPALIGLVYLLRKPDNSYISRTEILNNPDRLSLSHTQRLLRECCEGKDYFLPSQVGLPNVYDGERHEFFALDIVQSDAVATSDISLSKMLGLFQAGKVQGWEFGGANQVIEETAKMASRPRL